MAIWWKKMMNRYEKYLMDDVRRIGGFLYKDIKHLHEYPLEISRPVLKILVENSCLGQNYGPIEVSRKKINEINKAWLKENLIEVAYGCIDFSDEWEYRRLVELVVYTIPELKQKVLDFGIGTENEEIREVVRDFQET